MLLINYEIDLFMTWSGNYIISDALGATTCGITNTKLYVSVVTLSTQDNSKLLQQLKPGSNRTTDWNIYQSKVTT